MDTTAATRSRRPRRHRLSALLGTLVATAALLGGVQALAPPTAGAMMDLNCEELGDCTGGGGTEGGGWEGGGGWGDEGGWGEEGVGWGEESPWETREEDEAYERELELVAEQKVEEERDAREAREEEADDAEEPDRVAAEEEKKVDELAEECDYLMDQALSVDEAGDQDGADSLGRLATICGEQLVNEKARLGIPEEELKIGPVTVTPVVPQRRNSAPEAKFRKKSKKKGAKSRADKVGAAR